jgi:hypothetical protein
LASLGLIRLTQLTTPVWQAPTACVFDSTTGKLNDPASSIHVVPVISPLPFSEYQPAAHACPTPSRPRGRMAVTPVRTDGPSINVVTPTSTPSTSVIALRGPGCPGRTMPSPRVLGRPSLVWVWDVLTRRSR